MPVEAQLKFLKHPLLSGPDCTALALRSAPNQSNLFASLPEVTEPERLSFSAQQNAQALKRLETIASLVEFSSRSRRSRPTFRTIGGVAVRSMNSLAGYLADQHHVSARTLWNWYAQYRKLGYAGLVDRVRSDKGKSRLRFDLSQRKVLLVFDEAQHLSIECLETLRELLDQPPHCGLLFAGTHELEEIFTRQALELEQWRSRFHAGQALPGISEQEAADIVHSELGLGLPQRKIQKLISKSRITDLRNGGQHSYVSARRLFWVIRELQAAAN